MIDLLQTYRRCPLLLITLLGDLILRLIVAHLAVVGERHLAGIHRLSVDRGLKLGLKASLFGAVSSSLTSR